MKSQTVINALKESIREIQDFPKPGINFYDITTLLKKKEGFRQIIDLIYEKFKDEKIDYVVSIESRGFIFGSALAYKFNAGFVPIRKKGKLPAATYSVSYDLEYGQDTLEIHTDAIEEGKNILLVDDLLATGGTVRAAADLCRKNGANIISLVFLIELTFLGARSKLSDLPVTSLLAY